MKVSGDEAKKWKAVDRDTYTDISGNLVEADEDMGSVVYMDQIGQKRELKLGPHRVLLILKDLRDRYPI